MISTVLGIESSCDETAASVVKEGKYMLSNVVSSQVATHEKFGGVVPEIASRKHIESIIPVIEQAVSKAGCRLSEIDAIAVTQGPGLIGSLMVGLSVAKALSFSLDKPFVGVNHIEAHTCAVHIEHQVPFPFIALVVSGGHTSIYLVNDFTEYVLIGKTRDDAAGEAFDKAARILGLGYPGGAKIDTLARKGNPEKIKFPRPFMDRESFDFSYSGLKTSLLYYVKKNPITSKQEMHDICASYQEAIVDTLVNKTVSATKYYNIKNVVICGGVACNSRLREVSKEIFKKENINLFIPSPQLCTDNAAMVASLGYFRLKKGLESSLDVEAFSTISN